MPLAVQHFPEDSIFKIDDLAETLDVFGVRILHLILQNEHAGVHDLRLELVGQSDRLGVVAPGCKAGIGRNEGTL